MPQLPPPTSSILADGCPVSMHIHKPSIASGDRDPLFERRSPHLPKREV